jgi:hypothetical protein
LLHQARAKCRFIRFVAGAGWNVTISPTSMPILRYNLALLGEFSNYCFAFNKAADCGFD